MLELDALAQHTYLMTNIESLIASLAVQDPTGVYLDRENIVANCRYFDWCTQVDDHSGIRRMEIGDGRGEAIQFDMSREDMVRLHAALTVYLLTNPE